MICLILYKTEKSHIFDESGNLYLYSVLNYIDELANSNITHAIEAFGSFLDEIHEKEKNK